MSADVKKNLKDQLSRLLVRHDKLDAHLTNADREVPADWDDRAQMMENDEVLEGIDAVTRDEIVQIRAALNRIDRGTYGVCARCEESISDGRLVAVPTAALCINCARAE
ncbi:MAG: TraR/DksA family transcriptional regulator [Proteobacteria bacterium]|nr:TraR/DksA family transcriptional regulator [Pseudomonadota bacterium]